MVTIFRRMMTERNARREDRLYREALGQARRLVAYCHSDWYVENPWARGLQHGQLLFPRTEGVPGYVGRVSIVFDEIDFAEWKRNWKDGLAANSKLQRWQWMLEAMDPKSIMGKPRVIPGSRRPLDGYVLSVLRPQVGTHKWLEFLETDQY